LAACQDKKTSGWSERWRHDVGRDVLDILDMVVVVIFWQNIRQWVGGELLAKFPNLQSYDPK